jgi:fumarate hydratase subunit beta
MAQNVIEINVINLAEEIPGLHVGDRVLLSGTIYTARDAVHLKMFELLDSVKTLPFEIDGSVIYYAGPTPARPGMPVGSCGPTTSGRMDKFSPRLLELGLLGMIGKGERSAEVVDAMVKRGAIYFCAVGGAGALIAKSIKSAEVVAFPELGCESLKRMTVEKMPLTVGIDCRGDTIFKYKPLEAARGR